MWYFVIGLPLFLVLIIFIWTREINRVVIDRANKP